MHRNVCKLDAPMSALVSQAVLLIPCRFVAELPVKMAPLLAEVEATKVCKHVGHSIACVQGASYCLLQ
jgi:hypothetical protein